MGGKSKKIDEILDTLQFIVEYLQEKVATKEELHTEISQVRNEMADHVDKFIGLHKCMETETVSIKSAVKRHDDYFDQISGHLKLDLKNS